MRQQPDLSVSASAPALWSTLPVALCAALLIVAISLPVWHAPGERIFGAAIVGPHHDPLTAMEVFRGPLRLAPYTQPATDLIGAAFARMWSAVTAYNLVVTMSFPLAAAGAAALARHLGLGVAAASAAGLIFAFSPFHVAHAAYHPHVAQTQWIPWFLLAVWRALDAATLSRLSMLFVVSSGTILANFYAGFIAAALAPTAVAAYWATRHTGAVNAQSLLRTLAVLLAVAVAGFGYVAVFAAPLLARPEAFAAASSDVAHFSARWSSYLMPPVHHPWLGDMALRYWQQQRVADALLEQQLAVGVGVIVLALVGVWRGTSDRAMPPQWRGNVVLLLCVGGLALWCSLTPPSSLPTLLARLWPSALLYDVLPMFRAYARFAVVVQLVAALLAGVGMAACLHSRSRPTRVALLALLIMIAFEYAVPASLSRDALPTAAHRWVASIQEPVRVLDCGWGPAEAAATPWLSKQRIVLPSPPFADCFEPNFGQKLAASGYSHVLLRHDGGRQREATHTAHTAELKLVKSFPAADVLRVDSAPPDVYTAELKGFYPREHNGDWTWRWMGRAARWTVINRAHASRHARLSLEMTALARSQPIEIRVNGTLMQRVVAVAGRRHYALDAVALGPGTHEVAFQATGPLGAASTLLNNGDPRVLSVAMGHWAWTIEERTR